MVKNDIKSDDELFAAHEQKSSGQKQLANFVLNQSPKNLQDLISNTWKMQEAVANLQEKNIPRMDVIRRYSTTKCVEGCSGTWLQCAMQVLTQKNVNPVVFANALRELLEKGRGKHRNVLIISLANCAKTFLLIPLQIIFKTFSNPSNDKYAWIGVDKAQVVFLNDFRWSQEMIAWKELLLLLEGQPVHLPSPKNHFSSDICISNDIPVFSTSKC